MILSSSNCRTTRRRRNYPRSPSQNSSGSLHFSPMSPHPAHHLCSFAKRRELFINFLGLIAAVSAGAAQVRLSSLTHTSTHALCCAAPHVPYLRQPHQLLRQLWTSNHQRQRQPFRPHTQRCRRPFSHHRRPRCELPYLYRPRDVYNDLCLHVYLGIYRYVYGRFNFLTLPRRHGGVLTFCFTCRQAN